MANAYGFTAGNADMSVGDEPELAKRLDALGKYLKTSFTGVSGYRTPARSVAVGGTANDPHTQAAAVDVSSNIDTVPEATLNQFGLTRPLTSWVSPTDGTVHNEDNHIQLTSATATARTAASASNTPAPSSSSGGVAAGVGAAASVATGVAGAAAGALGIPSPSDIAQSIVSDLWDAIAPKAEYAGLFVVLVIAGAALVLFGVVRTTKTSAKDVANA